MLPPANEAVLKPEDFSLDHEFDGIVVRKTLWVKVISKGGPWCTIFVSFTEYKQHAWGEPEFKLVKLRKAEGFWRPVTTFSMTAKHMQGLLKACLLAIGQDQKLASQGHELAPSGD